MAEQTQKPLKNEKVGQVVSTKMAKTIIVEVSRRVPHPLYKRIVKKRKRFHAHDEEGRAKMGDIVTDHGVPAVEPHEALAADRSGPPRPASGRAAGGVGRKSIGAGFWVLGAGVLFPNG